MIQVGSGNCKGASGGNQRWQLEKDSAATPGCEDGGRSHKTGGLEAGKGQEMDSPRASRRNTALLPPVRAMSDSDFQNWKKLNVCLKS